MTFRLLVCWFSTYLLAGSAVMPTAAGSTPHLFDVTTAHGVLAGTPIRPTDVFAPEDTPVYVSFRCEGCTAGTVITSSWLYLEQDPPLQFARGSVVVEAWDEFGEFHFDLPSGMRWSLGAYRIDLRVNDDVFQVHARFSVRVQTE